jgi:cobalt-zinc-cadmium efflux system membrane fusion protein
MKRTERWARRQTLPLLIFAAITLSACQSRSTAAAPDAAAGKPKAQDNTKDGGVITVNQKEQDIGHVVVEAVRFSAVSGNLVVPGSLTVNEDRTWHVGAIAGGRVEDITARVGDMVRAGQILGRIHSHDVHEAQAGFQQASIELERADSAANFARQRYDRAQRLFDLRAGSRQDVETAEGELRNAQASIAKAHSELEKERAHLEILSVPASEAAQNSQADDVPILAPAQGVILARKVSVGSVLNTGDELFTVTDTDSLWMIASANEADLAELRAGQAVRVRVRAYPDREFAGRILKLGEQLDPATRTLQVRILVPNAQGLLKPEMYAAAVIQRSGRRSGIFLPEGSIQDIEGVSAVFVRRAGDRFEARTVKTGQSLDGEAEILEGLNPGEVVVVKGGFALKSQLLRSSIEEK